MPGKKNIEERLPELRELAKYLAINAMSHSIDDARKAGKDDNVFVTPEKDVKYATTRNILIMGAGASHSVHESIPLASDFVTDLKKKFNEQFTKDGREGKTMLENQIDFLVQAYNLNADEFETVMQACSGFDNQMVLDELLNKYDLKYVPNLFCEITGHLFKHRYIDVIINFNFDEILNNVIEEELSSFEYHYILSDGDVDEKFEDLVVGHRLKKPIYIKPHGTISHPSSMRFDKQQYFKLPKRINALLAHLFLAECEYAPNKHLNLNIITVGFGMQSIDLNYILRKALEIRKNKAKFNFFAFDTLPPDKYYKALQKAKYFENIDFENSKSSNKDQEFPKEKQFFNYIKVDKRDKRIDTSKINLLNNTLDSLFFRLSNCIFCQYRNSELLRNISRHLIISLIFQRKDIKPLRIFKTSKENNFKTSTESNQLDEVNLSRSQFYLSSRIYVEIGLLLVHSNGLINITQLKESRISKYYTLLQKVYSALPVHQQPEEKKNMQAFIKEFGLVPYKGFAKDVFVYPAFYQYSKKRAFIAQLVTTTLGLLAALQTKFNIQDLNQEIFGNDEPILRKHFLEFEQNSVWQIKASIDEFNISKFETVGYENLLHTDLRFKITINSSYEKHAPNVVLGISKTFDYLLNTPDPNDKNKKMRDTFRRDFGEKSLYLILATSDIKQIEDVIDKQIKSEINPNEFNIHTKKLHWTLHNQQVHLFLKFKKHQYNRFRVIANEFNKLVDAESPMLSQQDNENIDLVTEPDKELRFALDEISKKVNVLINFDEGFYYNRKMLSRKANPIYLKKSYKNSDAVREDLIEMFDIFVNYWARAGIDKDDKDNLIVNKSSERSAHAVIDYKHFLTYKINLVNKIFVNLVD